jgi:hypothetical protein
MDPTKSRRTPRTHKKIPTRSYPPVKRGAVWDCRRKRIGEQHAVQKGDNDKTVVATGRDK